MHEVIPDRRSSAVSAISTVSRPPKARRKPDTLPVIDVSALHGRTERAKRKVAEALGAAAEEYGFLYIEGHGIEASTIGAVYQQASTWFRRPVEEKLRYYIGHSRNHRGYVPRTEQGHYKDEGTRYYEAFDLGLDVSRDDPDVSPANPLLGPNVWPAQPGFRETVGRYYEQMAGLGRRLGSALELYFGAPPGTLGERMTKPTSQLRLLHYVENDVVGDQSRMNMGAHTDYECFTLLHQEGPGLEVLNVNDRWMKAPPLEGTFVVNIGDMLEVWSNARCPATLHRVVNNGVERMSLPFFVAANYDAVIEPLAQLVPRGRRPAYAPVVAGHHLLGQLLRDFPYLRERYDRGRLRVPFPIPEGNPFETRRLAGQSVLA